MKRLVALLVLVASFTFGVAQMKGNILPEKFRLSGATTLDSIEMLFDIDSMGMSLTPVFPPAVRRDGRVAIGIELFGYANPKERENSSLIFGLAAYADSWTAVEHRIELLNFVTNTWDTVAVFSSSPNIKDWSRKRPFVAPFTSVEVDPWDYVDPISGQIRTRVFWIAPKGFRTIWVDFAGWQLFTR